MKEEQPELVPQVSHEEPSEDTALAVMIGGDSIIEVARHAEARVEAVKKIKSLAIQVTNNQDWVDENGKPYLQASGGEKIARLFGISWTIDEPKCENEESGHYQYTYKGCFAMGQATIEAIGTRSSSDPFFSRAKGEDIPIERIDRANVKKSAYTNCIGNGITRMLGIRNLTWEEVGKRSTTRVSYDGKNDQSEEEQAKKDKDLIYKMLTDLHESGFEHKDLPENPKREDILNVLTKTAKFKGWKSVEKMSPQGASITRKQLTPIHKQWVDSIG